MPPPDNYDDPSYVIDVDPNEMWTCVNLMVSFGKGSADAVSSVINTWNALNVSWMGSSASTAQSYMNSLNNAIGQLLGTKSDPSAGAFNIVSNGIGNASINYAATEQWVKGYWDGFASGMATLDAPTTGQQGMASDVAPTVKTPGDGPFTEDTP